MICCACVKQLMFKNRISQLKIMKTKIYKKRQKEKKKERTRKATEIQRRSNNEKNKQIAQDKYAKLEEHRHFEIICDCANAMFSSATEETLTHINVEPTVSCAGGLPCSWECVQSRSCLRKRDESTERNQNFEQCY